MKDDVGLNGAGMTIRTTIVEGRLALHMHRLEAARAGHSGLQIFTVPQLAARLAGGFATWIDREHLEPAIQTTLDQGGFVELEPVRRLPGTARALASTLRKAWDADLDFCTAGYAESPRICELQLVLARLRAILPKAMLTTRELRDAALERIQHSPRIIGPVCIDRLTSVAPVWRPLIEHLSRHVPVEWRAYEEAETGWFSGVVRPIAHTPPPSEPSVVSCADPHHEVVESLRWARQLITSGTAKPHEIAIAAVSATSYDDHFLAVVTRTGLKIHFLHGIPALSTRDGQRCAALADILMHGVNQQRMRRLLALCRGHSTIFDDLLDRWMGMLPRGATLLTLEDWVRALEVAKRKDASLHSFEDALPLLATLARGRSASREAAALLLSGRSLQIWNNATCSAPVDAIEMSLRDVRLATDSDPADSVVWCPARDLAAAPRPYVRLLGFTNRGWPRRTATDPILPDHIVPARVLEPDPTSRADRRHFQVIIGAAARLAVLSRSRRGAQGSRVGRSPLLRDRPETLLSRARIPEHAFGEADRLMARPKEARQLSQIKSAGHCWRDWHVENITAHDGRFEPGNLVIRSAIERIQSATSLQRMLRDPLGFVLRHALGLEAPQERAQPLTIAPDEFGKLVHELLRRTVDSLEPDPGYANALEPQIEACLRRAADAVRETWPLERPVPPKLLWANTVEYASTMALAGLLRKEIGEATTRSWTEVPFGQPSDFDSERDLPWSPTTPVLIPGTPIRLRGTIDRLDLRKSPAAARVTDYKTGNTPKNPSRIVIGGGAELQRCLYGLACRQLLEDDPVVIARLLYLAGEPLAVRLEDLDGALGQVSDFVNEVVSMLERGMAVPGRSSFDRTNDLRLALPASPGYERRKRMAFGRAADKLSRYWSYP
jgi:hypothetical protein